MDYPHKMKYQKKTDCMKHHTIVSRTMTTGGRHRKQDHVREGPMSGQSDQSGLRAMAVCPEPSSDTVRHAAMPSPNTIKR